MGSDFACFVWLGLNAAFNDISVISRRSVLLVQESGELEENHRPLAGNGFDFQYFIFHFDNGKKEKESGNKQQYTKHYKKYMAWATRMPLRRG